ncbi:uncharacterized protein LOC124898406 [Capsicum annuum]|uniref:uncharacterized protein LOC124898406 n=1 Tax=Capsicum annuum TaxID=4072 RepID=UPI001FB18EF2|nr:uncharacterized protein LOC124898406 [Capsicum annuum]
MEDDSMHMKDFSSDSQHNEEDCGTASQPGQSFSNGTNFCCGQTFTDKKELKILLDAAVARQSFDYYMEKKCTKLINVKCLSRGYGWLLWEKKHETLNRFRIYKYVGLHTCGVEHATRRNKKDGKGPSIREIQKNVFKELRCNASYWMYWKESVIAKNIIRGTPEHEYACLLNFSHMVELFNPKSSYSIMVNQMDELGVMLSAVAHDTENHIFPIAFYVVDKENNASWTLFFQKLKSIVEDEPNLCVISDRERHTFVDGKENIFVPYAERILRDNKSVRDSLYVSNPNGVLDQYTVFGNGVTAKVNLLKRSCSCQKFDLVKMYEHAMAALRTKYGDGEGYGNFV